VVDGERGATGFGGPQKSIDVRPEDGTGDWADPGVFLDPPPWAAVFADLGWFTLLGRELLTTPLDEVDTAALANDEWRRIRYWGPANVGRTLFNAWD
jgi:hypothetical protein